MDGAQGLRRARAAALLAAALALAAAPPPPREAAEAAGLWELSLEKSHRKCPITLALDESPVGRVLRFPVGCRRALPILNGAAGWRVDEGAVRLLDGDGRPLLAFGAPDDDEVMHARSEAGDGYLLERKGELRIGRPLPPLPPPLGVPQLTPVDPDKAPPLSAVPGTYVVDRYTEREVCRLTLGRAMLDPAGRYEVRLLEGCRDLGLAAFDPVAWRYEAGRLTITARRGHEVSLISERTGHWRRDPEVGAMLVLRKLAPP